MVVPRIHELLDRTKPVNELGAGLLIRVAECIYDLLEPDARHVLVEAKRGTFEHTYRLLGPPQFATSDAIKTSHKNWQPKNT